MRARRVAASVAVGAVAGLIVAGLVGIPRLAGPANVAAFISNAFTFWGVVLGGFAAPVAAGLTFAILNRRDRKTSRWGRVVAGAALAVFAAATVWWIAMWGFSPFSLEGSWLYALAIVTGIGSLLLLRPRRPSQWDEPPSESRS